MTHDEREGLTYGIAQTIVSTYPSISFHSAQGMALCALSAIEAAGMWIAPDEPSEAMREAFRMGELTPIRGAGGQTLENADRWYFNHGYRALRDAARGERVQDIAAEKESDHE